VADAISIAFTLTLAGFGGLVRYMQKFTGKKEERPVWEWSVAAITCGTGAFVGLLTLWVVQKKFEADYVHFLVAVAGYGGPLTLDAMWEAGRDVLRRLAGAPQGPKDGDAKG
jgi:hypothetical protein